MGSYYISIHIKSVDVADVRIALVDLFAEYGFSPIGETTVAVMVDADEGDAGESESYGVIISPRSGDKWVSVYVDDWQDSGVIAKSLSAKLEANALEIWIADDAYWGYSYFEHGEVRDRFADDPAKVTEQPAEASALVGRPEKLAPILHTPVDQFAQILHTATSNAGNFVGPAIDDIASAFQLPFEHILIGYELFFEDDPDDYASGLCEWPQWHHLSFRHPNGTDRLAA